MCSIHPMLGTVRQLEGGNGYDNDNSYRSNFGVNFFKFSPIHTAGGCASRPKNMTSQSTAACIRVVGVRML